MSGPAARWSAGVQRRPRSVAVLAVVLMAALAVPLLSLRLGTVDQGNDDASTTTRKAYDLLAEGFGPGFNGPLQVVVDGEASDGLVTVLEETEGVARVAAVPPANGVTVIQVVPTTSPQAEETDRLIDTLREDVIPQAGVEAHVGGVTAVSKDFATVTGERLPLFIGTIIGLGFLLLLLAFRSLVVPLTAAVMNLLAVMAAPLGSRAVHVTVEDGPPVHGVELTPGEVDAVNWRCRGARRRRAPPAPSWPGREAPSSSRAGTP